MLRGRTRLDADTEGITELRDDVHDRITREREFDALGACIHLLEWDINIDREKRVHTRIRSEAITNEQQQVKYGFMLFEVGVRSDERPELNVLGNLAEIEWLDECRRLFTSPPE